MQHPVTIVCPTYTRQHLVMASLAFYQGAGFRHVIMDGSAVPLEEDLGSDVLYEFGVPSIFDRLVRATECLDTEYTILRGDDELHLPAAIKAAVEFLDDNPDFVACGGQVVGFFRCLPRRLRRVPLVGTALWNRSPVVYHPVYEEFFDFRLDEESGQGRVEKHFATYMPASIYSVVRTEVWVRAMRAAVELGKAVSLPAMGELVFEAVVAAQGKVAHLPVIQWFRNFSNGEVSVKGFNRFVTTEMWQKDDSFAAERASFRNLLESEKFSEEERAAVAMALKTFNPRNVPHPFKSRLRLGFVVGARGIKRMARERGLSFDQAELEKAVASLEELILK